MTSGMVCFHRYWNSASRTPRCPLNPISLRWGLLRPRRDEYVDHFQIDIGKGNLGFTDLEICWRQCLGVFKDPIYALTEVFLFQ